MSYKLIERIGQLTEEEVALLPKGMREDLLQNQMTVKESQEAIKESAEKISNRCMDGVAALSQITERLESISSTTHSISEYVVRTQKEIHRAKFLLFKLKQREL